MRGTKKIILLLILFITIVITLLAIYFIWLSPTSNAGTVRMNNINNEPKLNNEEKDDDIIYIKVEDKTEEVKTTENKSETKTEAVIAPTFKDVNETVYAKNNVNVRTEPNASSQVVGVLMQGGSITRTGIGSNGWDRVTYNNQIRYISHSYLSTEEIKVVKNEPKIVTASNNTITTNSTNTQTYPDGWIENFNKQIAQLQQEFPKGSYWNCANGNTTGVTSIPCNHKANIYYCREYNGNSTRKYGITSAWQCAAFASMLSDRVFGTEANARIFYNYDEIRIGDQARINNGTHTVFIIDKTDDYVIVAECNADYKTCVINWGRRISRNNLAGFYVTRWD